MPRGGREAMRALIRRSAVAGLITGGATALLVLLIFQLYDYFAVVWPFALVPVFATGAYAVSRSGATVRGSGTALAAGAVAGFVAAIVSVIAILVATISVQKGNPFS